MPDAAKIAEAHACLYVEFPSRTVFHLVNADDCRNTWCGAWASIPYPAKKGGWITTYQGGTPFPHFTMDPAPARRLCKNCRRVAPPELVAALEP